MNNDELVYKQKYLKYKQKYLQLKQMGGMNSKTTSDIFNQEKKELLDELNKNKSKLLFPDSVIKTMKEQKLSIYELMNKYNDYLNKIRDLYRDLNNLTKWGLINDSHLNWKLSVNRNISNLNLNFNEIFNHVSKDDGELTKNVKTQCGIDLGKLTVYMTIIKKNGKYIWINTDTNKVHELKKQTVRELLPRCFNLVGRNMVADDLVDLDDSDELYFFKKD